MPIVSPIPSGLANQGRPNFLIIVSDDQRYDTMEFMPRTKSLVFDQGVTFSRGYVTTPLCCPSRSSILTGMCAHTHDVHTNTDSLEKTTFIEHLHENGYYTGLVGKYLNSWDGTYRPEFDFWAVFAGHSAASQYFDPQINLNGAWNTRSGYITHILRDYALEMVRQASQQAKPFVLVFAPNAPHDPADPAPGDEELYQDLPLYRPPSFGEEDLSDKPDWLQNRPPMKGIKRLDTFRRRQLQSLNALDQAVEEVLRELEKSDKLGNTMVIYLSDNAVFWGEHGLDGKTFVYEEAIHVPFAVRYLPLVPKPRIETRLVANIDIAPTLYELAKIPIPPELEGRSLVPLLKGEAAWRDALLIEGWPESIPGGENDGDQSELSVPYAAIHTDRYVYVETEGDRTELYDLKSDPYQLENQAGNPAYTAVMTDLQKRFKQAGDSWSFSRVFTYTAFKLDMRRTWLAQCTEPRVPLEPEHIIEASGRDDLRLVYFDCTQSWLYPTAGKSPGWVIISGDLLPWVAAKLERGRLSYEQKRTRSFPVFRIYEYDELATWPQGGPVRVASSTEASPEVVTLLSPIDLPISFQGGLTLLGYALDQPTLKPGETIYLETAWRVETVPERLLSVMAHALGPDGRLVTTGDGLGVPLESWQVGDVFVQRHALTLPGDAPPGQYWIQTGVYWLESGERWPVRDSRATGDRALLTTVEVRR